MQVRPSTGLGNFADQVHKGLLMDEEFSTLLSTGRSCGEPPSMAGTSEAFLIPLEEFLLGPFPYSGPNVAGLLARCQGPHLCCHSGQHLGWGDPGNFPMASSPSSCFFLFSISLSEVGVPTEGAPSWGSLFWPTLGVIFVLAI